MTLADSVNMPHIPNQGNTKLNPGMKSAGNTAACSTPLTPSDAIRIAIWAP